MTAESPDLAAAMRLLDEAACCHEVGLDPAEDDVQIAGNLGQRVPVDVPGRDLPLPLGQVIKNSQW